MVRKNSTLRGENFRWFIFPVLFLTGFFIFTNIAQADTTTISQDTVWHDGQIIILDEDWSDLNINPGVKLTIEAGAILKLADYNNINVYGELEVLGTAESQQLLSLSRMIQLAAILASIMTIPSPVAGEE